MGSDSQFSVQLPIYLSPSCSLSLSLNLSTDAVIAAKAPALKLSAVLSLTGAAWEVELILFDLDVLGRR